MQNRDNNGWAELQFRRNDESSGNPDGHGNWSSELLQRVFHSTSAGPGGDKVTRREQCGPFKCAGIASCKHEYSTSWAPEGRSPQMIEYTKITRSHHGFITDRYELKFFLGIFGGLSSRHPPGTDQNRNFGTQLYLDFSSAMAVINLYSYE